MRGTGPVSGHTRQWETARKGESETVCVPGTIYRCGATVLVQGPIFISPAAAESQGVFWVRLISITKEGT